MPGSMDRRHWLISIAAASAVAICASLYLRWRASDGVEGEEGGEDLVDEFGYQHCTLPPKEVHAGLCAKHFATGETVYLSNRKLQRAQLLGRTRPCSKDEGDGSEKILVRLVASERIVSVPASTPASRLFPACSVVVVGETAAFRRLCKEQLLAGDVVLEIGCSMGVSSKIILARTANLLGVDVSVEAVAACKAIRSRGRFEVVDLLATPHRARELLSEMGHTGARRHTGGNASIGGAGDSVSAEGTVCDRGFLTDYVFVDVGGDREAGVASRLVRWAVKERIGAVVVVKNRELGKMARRFLLNTHMAMPRAPIVKDPSVQRRGGARLTRRQKREMQASQTERRPPSTWRGAGPYQDVIPKVGEWWQFLAEFEERALKAAERRKRTKTCSLCKSPDHMIRQCPDLSCRRCGAKRAHFHWECPTAGHAAS